MAMANNADRSSDRTAVVVMNPRSGDGKVGRFRLVEQARAAGAQVRLTGTDQDAAALASRAVAEGAAVLGVAGGDGAGSAGGAAGPPGAPRTPGVPAGCPRHRAP